MLTLIQGPQVLPISLAEVKAAGRLDGLDASEDAVIAGLIRAAVAEIDGPRGWLGRCLITQSWTYWADAFPYTISVPLPPLQSIDAVRYVDSDGNVQTLDSSAYHVSGIGGSGLLVPVVGQRWPATQHRPEAVMVDFTAGYGPSWNDVPEDIRSAITLMVTAAYDGCTSDPATSILMRHRAW